MADIDLKLQELCDYTKLAWDRQLTESTGGNMSIRIEDKIYITPTSYIKHFIKPEDLVVLNMEGNKIGGEYEPSSETKMHVKVYQENKKVRSIFHAHPRWSLVYATTHKRIPINILPETFVQLNDIAYIPYATPGTQAFADILEHGLCNGTEVFVLENHGVTVLGETIKEAYAKLETLETCCFVSLIGNLVGNLKDIHEYELDKLCKN